MFNALAWVTYCDFLVSLPLSQTTGNVVLSVRNVCEYFNQVLLFCYCCLANYSLAIEVKLKCLLHNLKACYKSISVCNSVFSIKVL